MSDTDQKEMAYVEDPYQWHTWSPLPPPPPADPILLEDIILTDSDQPLYQQLLGVVADDNIEEDEKAVANGTKARFSALLKLVNRARYDLPYDLPVLKRKYAQVYGATTAFPQPRMMMLQLWTYEDIKSEMQYLLTYSNTKMGDLQNETEFFNPSVAKPSLDDLGVDCLGYDKWTRGHGRQGFQAVTHWGGSRNAYQPTGVVSSYAGRGLDPKHRYGVVRDFGSYGVSTTNPAPSRVIFACCGEKVGLTKGCWIMIDKTQELGRPVSYEVMFNTDPWPQFTKSTISAKDLTQQLRDGIRVGTAFRKINLNKYLGWHYTIQSNWAQLAPIMAQAILAYVEQIYDASSSDESLPMNPYGSFVQGTDAEPMVKDMIRALVRFNEVHCAWDVHPSTEGQWADIVNERLFKTGSVRVNFDSSVISFIIFEGFTGGDDGAPERITLLRIGDSDDAESLEALVEKLTRLENTWNLDGRPADFESEVSDNVSVINTLIEDTENINEFANNADERLVPIDQWNLLLEKTRNLANPGEKRVADAYIDAVKEFDEALNNADSALSESRRNANNTLKKLHKYAMEPSNDTRAELNAAEDLFDDAIASSTQASTDLSDTLLAEADDLVVFAAPFQSLIDKLALYEAATEPGRSMPKLPVEQELENLPRLPSLITNESLRQYLLDLQSAGVENVDVNNIFDDLVTITTIPTQALEQAEEVLDGANVLLRSLPNADAQTRSVVRNLSAAKLAVESQLNQRLLDASGLAKKAEKLIKGLYAASDGSVEKGAYAGALELLSNENAAILELGYVNEQSLLEAVQKVREERTRLEELARSKFREIIGNTAQRCLALSKALTEQLDRVPLSRTMIPELRGINGKSALKTCINEIRSVLNNPFPVELTSGNNPITNTRMMTLLDDWRFTTEQVFPLPSDGSRDYAPYTKYWLSRIFMPILNFMNVLRVLDDLTAANLLLATLESPAERAAVFDRLEQLRIEAASEKARRQAERDRRKETVFTNIEGVVQIPNVVVLPRAGQPLFTISNFNNTRNTCPLDTVLTLLFKIPRTWLEMDVMRLANRVRVFGVNCTKDEAIKLHEYLLQDLTLLQGTAKPKECKSAKSFVSCVKTPVEFDATNNEFKYSEPEVIYENVKAFYMVNDAQMPAPIDLEQRAYFSDDPNVLEFDATEYRVDPEDMQNTRARLIAFTSPTDIGARFEGLNNDLQDIVQPPGTDFMLAGVILKRPAHFTTAMRDPRTGDWWYFDAYEKTYDVQNMSRSGDPNLIDPDTGVFLGIRQPVNIVQSVDGAGQQSLRHRPVFWLYMRSSDLRKTQPEAQSGESGARSFVLSATAERVVQTGDVSGFNNAIKDKRQVQSVVTRLKRLSLPANLDDMIGFEPTSGLFGFPVTMARASLDRKRALVYVWDQIRQATPEGLAEVEQNIRIALLSARVPQPGMIVEPLDLKDTKPEFTTPPNSELFELSREQFPVPPEFSLSEDDVLEDLVDQPDRFQAYLYYRYQQQLPPKNHPDRENNMRFAKLAGRLAFL